jgi:hypothetical protein
MSITKKIALRAGAALASAAAAYALKKLVTMLVAPKTITSHANPEDTLERARMGRMSRKARKQHRAAKLGAAAHAS